MLIRSQDKKTFINLDMTCRFSVIKNSSIIITADGITMGEYSTKGKAVKVLDMIQEAYADYRTAENMSTGLTSAIYTRHYASEEEIDKLLTSSKESARILKEAHIFQMPTDSEVVV